MAEACPKGTERKKRDMGRGRRIISGMLLAAALLAACTGAGAATETWQFDERGFLTGENPAEEYLLEDAENGKWEYASRDLSVRITRFQETRKIKSGKRTVEYCVAEIHASETSPLFAITTEGSARLTAGEHKEKPEKLVELSPAVLAVSDDYYGHRIQTRKSNGATWPVGIIIRNGELLSDKTRDSSKKRAFPPMDTLAVYADGSMKTYASDEMTGEEYLAQGAAQVFSFGPWLIREGQINEQEAGDKAVYLNYSEPRLAVGMVEPYHYIIIAVKGEPKDKYIGVKGEWLIPKMQEYGCTEALNMDGGGTVCMVFNGKTILQGKSGDRPLGSMIAFGKGGTEAEPADAGALTVRPAEESGEAAEETGEPAAETGTEETPAEDGDGKYPATARTAQPSVRVRKETDKTSERITQIKKAGTKVTLLGEALDGDGMLWYYVRTENGKEGYVRGDMLKVDP